MKYDFQFWVILTPPSVISELQKDSGMEGLKHFFIDDGGFVCNGGM
jgi:hypothetical protein